jgi:hypothetical protein
MVAVVDRQRVALPAERVFYLSMAVVIFAAVFLGFARSFYLRFLFPDWPAPPERIFYIKGAIFTAWYVLLIVQAGLITLDRRGLHRGLGVLGACIAALMVITGIYGSLVAAARPPGIPGVTPMPLAFLVVPAVDMAMFAILVGLAIAKRNRPQTHKRLILIASIGLVVASVARWPLVPDVPFPVYFAITDILLVPLIVWDVASRGRPHPATVAAGGALVASQFLRFAIGSSPVWLAFAAWAVNLVR